MDRQSYDWDRIKCDYNHVGKVNRVLVHTQQIKERTHHWSQAQEPEQHSRHQETDQTVSAGVWDFRTDLIFYGYIKHQETSAEEAI